MSLAPVLWRTEIRIRIDELRHRLTVVEIKEGSKPPASPGDARKAHLIAAREALGKAEAVIEETVDRRLGLVHWWTGTAVTSGWEYVHEAEAELVELESEEDLRATLPALTAWMQEVMPPDGRRKHYEQKLDACIEGEEAIDRTVVRQTYRDVILANNEKHASIRELRNRILLAVAALTVLLLTVAVWHAVNPEFVSLCGPPQAEGEARHCVSDTESPSSRDVIEIEVLGAIGGLLSLAFVLGSSKASPSRYDPRISQLLLKPTAGAATALLGVILVQSKIFVAPANNISESVLFAYAAIFGFSQQLLTQMVDNRAGKMLTEPTKSS
jgi:hypothetical protein